jgi:hypothetical protein
MGNIIRECCSCFDDGDDSRLQANEMYRLEDDREVRMYDMEKQLVDAGKLVAGDHLRNRRICSLIYNLQKSGLLSAEFDPTTNEVVMELCAHQFTPSATTF